MQEQSARVGGYTNTFAYDAAYNPTTFKGQTNSYNANNQNANFTFDERGNPLTYKGVSVTWDPENRMTSYGTVMSAGYTAGGIRAWKGDAQGNHTYYIYDGGAPLLELDGQGNVSAVNTFGPTGLLSRHSATGSTFYTFDAQGSVAQRLDSNGSVLTTSIYDSFGNKVSTEPQSDPWGYNAQAGYYTDGETGLSLCTHRYYDPTQGRWLNRDPIGYAGGVNLYGYVGNGPLAGLDPNGTAVFGIPDGAIAAGATTIGLVFVAGTPVGWAFACGVGIGAAVGYFTDRHGDLGLSLADGIGGASGASEMMAGSGMMGGGGGGGGGGGELNPADEAIVVRGGTADLPPPGTVFSGAHGPTLEDAGCGIPYGQLRQTTAGNIRAGGGTVIHKPELSRGGVLNERHCNITEGTGPSSFSDLQQNPVPPQNRIQ